MLIKVSVEADLVADLGGAEIDPGFIHVRTNLAQKIGVDILFQGDVFGIAQVRVGLVLDVLARGVRWPVAEIGQHALLALKIAKRQRFEHFSQLVALEPVNLLDDLFSLVILPADRIIDLVLL